MDLNTYLQKTFAELAQKVPGFISVAIVNSDGIVASYPSQLKKEIELTGPFHLQIYKQAVDSLNISSGGEGDAVKEILISTEKKLYVLESRSQRAIGVLTMDIDKANLGIARRYSEMVTDEVFRFFKESGVYYFFICF